MGRLTHLTASATSLLAAGPVLLTGITGTTTGTLAIYLHNSSSTTVSVDTLVALYEFTSGDIVDFTFDGAMFPSGLAITLAVGTAANVVIEWE